MERERERGGGGGEGKLSAGEEEKRGERRGDLFDLQRRREREEKFAGWRIEGSQETGGGEEARNLQHPPIYVSLRSRWRLCHAQDFGAACGLFVLGKWRRAENSGGGRRRGAAPQL